MFKEAQYFKGSLTSPAVGSRVSIPLKNELNSPVGKLHHLERNKLIPTQLQGANHASNNTFNSPIVDKHNPSSYFKRLKVLVDRQRTESCISKTEKRQKLHSQELKN